MTDDSIETKALALPDRLRIIPDANGMMYDDYDDVMEAADLIEAQAAENEQLLHDLERQMTIANEHVNELEAFRREVSDAVKDACKFAKEDPDRLTEYMALRFAFLIIPKPKPDPLVEVIAGWTGGTVLLASDLRAALEARGLEIREKGQ
jgi:hypothetical protein